MVDYINAIILIVFYGTKSITNFPIFYHSYMI